MPVAGLPAAVEGTLEVLLMENQLSSWKVSREGSKTVVVLRLTALTSMAEHATHTVQQYRRKPPSQQNRDKKRAEEYSKRFSQQKDRRTHCKINRQVTLLILASNGCLTKTQNPVHMNTDEYRDVRNSDITARNFFPVC